MKLGIVPENLLERFVILSGLLPPGIFESWFSVAICRRYPQLRSIILDLPQAIQHAAPLLAKEGMGDRVVHRAGNALTDDLGAEAYDLVLLAAVVHHFDEATNRELMRRVMRIVRSETLNVSGLWKCYCPNRRLVWKDGWRMSSRPPVSGLSEMSICCAWRMLWKSCQPLSGMRSHCITGKAGRRPRLRPISIAHRQPWRG